MKLSLCWVRLVAASRAKSTATQHITGEQFLTAALEAKENCPVAHVLRASLSLKATLQ
jgi:organic hydroperoxide reductase OsmC/OhrA